MGISFADYIKRTVLYNRVPSNPIMPLWIDYGCMIDSPLVAVANNHDNCSAYRHSLYVPECRWCTPHIVRGPDTVSAKLGGTV
jgi:hypothetical protein